MISSSPSSFNLAFLLVSISWQLFLLLTSPAEASSWFQAFEAPEGITNETASILPWGDVNLIVLTDVHSWIAGHERHEANMNVDYGDIISFVQRLRRYVTRDNIGELYLVMNGDFMDGTGLSTRPPKYLTPLLKEMPFDIINLGNHELYDNETVDWINEKFIPSWNGRYLTSNTLYHASQQSLGNRYTILQGKRSSVLVFGFLFNFQGHSKNTIVEKVQDAVRQGWFLHALKTEEYDSILVMAHMNVTDPLTEVILNAIRKIVPYSKMPVTFVTGHSHIRAFEVLDDNCVSFEAGRFLDTIGFISWNTTLTSRSLPPEERFPHVMLDANRDLLTSIVKNLDSTTHSLSTIEGLRLTDKIHTTQDSLGLLKTVGCSPDIYSLRKGIKEPLSLWGLYIEHVLPQVLLQRPHQVFVQGTGTLRYDLMNGTIVVDDVIAVCPFNDTIYKIAGNLRGRDLLNALNISYHPSMSSVNPNTITAGKSLPFWVVATPSSLGSLDLETQYEILTSAYHVDYLQNQIANETGLPKTDKTPVSKSNTEYQFTTDLWVEYISSNWPCSQPISIFDLPHPTSPPNEDEDTEEKPLIAAIFLNLILLGLWAYRKRRSRFFEYRAIPACAV